jgi:hypothetical protein
MYLLYNDVKNIYISLLTSIISHYFFLSKLVKQFPTGIRTYKIYNLRDIVLCQAVIDKRNVISIRTNTNLYDLLFLNSDIIKKIFYNFYINIMST